MNKKPLSKNLKKIGVNALLALASMVLVVFVAEVFLRLLWPQNLNITQLDDELRFELKPGITSILERQDFNTMVAISSQGLRDREYSLQKPEGVYRVAIVGDSFTFGFGVEQNETFTEILEKSLNGRGNKRYEVMNFGVSAYGTEQEYLVIRKKVLTFNPDMVIVAFYLNDVKENVKYNLFSVEDGMLKQAETKPVTSIQRLRNFISWHSHLYSLFYFSVIERDALSSLLIRSHIINAPVADPGVDFDKLIYARNKSEEYDLAMSKTVMLLKEMHGELTRMNVSFAIMLIPTKEQVYDQEMTKFLIQRGLLAKDIDRTKVQRNISNALQKESIPIIDMLGPLREHADEDRLYFPIDGHWTPRGHDIAAQELEHEIVS